MIDQFRMPLKAKTPLGADVAASVQIGQISIAEKTDYALASLAAFGGSETALEKALVDHFDLKLPATEKLTISKEFSAFWMGPNQWMMRVPYEKHVDLAAKLVHLADGQAAVSEQTDGWCVFSIEGETRNALMERLCNVDLRRLDAGLATRTVIEHLGCFVLCEGRKRPIEIMGPRSSAQSLYHAITSMAKSIA